MPGTKQHGAALVAVVALLSSAGIAAGPIDGQLQANTANDPQKAIAKVIEEICPPGNLLSADLQSRCNEIAGAILGGKGIAQGRAGLQAMAPEENSVVHATEVDTGKPQKTAVFGRLSSLRAGTAVANGFSIDGQRLRTAFALGASGDKRRGGGASGDDAGTRWGAYANTNFGTSDKDATSRESGFSADNYGLDGGVDYRFGEKSVLGVALGYVRSKADLDANGGKLRTDGYSVSGYGSFTPSKQVYVNAVLSYSSSNHDQNRAVAYSIGGTTVNQLASSSTDSRGVSVDIEAGYDIYQNEWTLTPYGRFNYARVKIDGYAEAMSNPAAAGSGLAVAIDAQRTISTTLSAGGRISRALETGWGTVYPQVGIEYIHEFDNKNKDITGRFIDDSSRTVFRLPTDRPDRNYGIITAGVSADFRKGWSGHVQYQGLIGYKNTTLHALDIGLRLDF